VRNASPENRWGKVETLFLEAAELPPGAIRERFVEERCGDDTRLREEVLSLLRYDSSFSINGSGGPTLLDALQASAASVVGDDLAAGRMVGPYRIEHEIGRGGMAVVYLAVRADGEFRKRVAIKLIKRGMDTEAVVERLRRERRILAALEHPSIARLLDGGTTADGRPWIAMEYVEGLPIDQYCEERNLSIAERLLLIDRVCDAVAYAHRGLVVHRDLKPENILIAPDGNPKLLDFGIAKLLAPGDNASEEETADEALTRGLSQPMTPRYASPEQKRGEPVGTATDVYSLGLVLHELLAGQRPADSIKASAAALLAGKEPRWSKRLAGDLDNILCMALRPEPERRYLTVEQMQADLRRHLAGLPVAARRETWSYRFGKFFHRHPVGASAAALIAVAAVASVVTIARAERDAQVQRRKAEQRLGQMVELANRALFNVHGSIERLPGATQARLEIVRTTVEYLDRLNAETGSDVRVLSALASGYARVARVQGSPLQPNLGDQRGAEASYVKAAKILDSLMAASAEKSPDNSDQRLRDAQLRIEYGALLAETGRKDDAIVQYRRGLDQADVVLARDPHNIEARKATSRLHVEIGQVTKYKDPAGTRRTDLELLPLYEALAREYPRDTDCLLDLGSLWSQIGSTFEEQDNPADAAGAFRKSASLREQVFALRPQDVSVQHDLLIAYGHLGDLTGSPMFASLGDYRGSVVWYRKAAAIARQMAAADHSNVQARTDEGTALLRIGASQTAAGENREAKESLRQAEALLAPSRAASPASVPLAERVALIYQYQGRAFEALGENAAATEALRRSLDVCRAVIANHADPTCRHAVWTDQAYLATALASMGDRAAGLRESQDALDSVMHPADARDPTLPAYRARALAGIGAVHVVLAKCSTGDGRLTEWRAAAGYYRRAVVEWRTFPGWTREPFVGEMRQAQAALAASERAMRGAYR
jgi:eukaryotic-like serine/threonine-protein kinase